MLYSHLDEGAAVNFVSKSLAFVAVTALAIALFRAPATGALPAALQSPGATPSGSSTPTPTPSGSVSPSPSPSSSDFDPDYRRVRLQPSHRNVRVGRRVEFSGVVGANRIECYAGVKVQLERVISGTQRRLTIDSEETDARGRFRMTDDVRWTSVYYAVATRDNDCTRRESTPEGVRAHVRFNVKVSDRSPQRGANFRIHGRVRPSHPHSTVELQQRRRSRWKTIQRTAISDQSRFSFFPFASWQGKRDFRIKWPKNDRDHETGLSSVVTIRSHD